MSVLIVGIDDAEVQAVSAALRELGCPFDVLDTRAPIELTIAEGRAWWRLPGRAVDPAERPYAAVYTRLLGLAPTHPFDSPHWTRENFLRARFLDGEVLALKIALLQGLQAGGAAMFNGVAVAELELKASRLVALQRAGLPVPPSLFTQDPAALREFAARHGELIAKPVTGGTRVERLRPADFEAPRIDRLARAPVTFQPVVPGPDIRVYVCDGEVLAAVRVRSEHDVDARGRETAYEAFDPAGELADACVRACQVLSLRFSAVDLRAGARGQFCVLECNNHPMFANIDRAIGGPVARGLARRLAQLNAAP